jgi:hypothetical protein
MPRGDSRNPMKWGTRDQVSCQNGFLFLYLAVFYDDYFFDSPANYWDRYCSFAVV